MDLNSQELANTAWVFATAGQKYSNPLNYSGPGRNCSGPLPPMLISKSWVIILRAPPAQLGAENAKNQIFFEISNGRLPLEDGSDRRETLAKRVSDDLQLSIF